MLGIDARIAIIAVLAAGILAGCGGGGSDSTTGACQARPDVTITSFNYPDAPIGVGTTVSLAPVIDATPGATPGDNLAGAALRFDLISGGLPIGLSLDPNSGVIAGKVTAVGGGSFPVTIRLTCAAGSITTSAFFMVI